jgi:hypothetical protein
MRFLFRVRAKQKYPSYIDIIEGRVVDASPKFAWAVGLREDTALDWMARKALGPQPPWKARPNTVKELNVLWQICEYARSLSEDRR